MPPKTETKAQSASGQPSKKRKEPPTSAQSKSKSNGPSKRQKTVRDARQISAQTTSKAFKNGALDVSAFVKAREFEIRALEDGMDRSKKALAKRAFQMVPRELRRRTASHDVKRIPRKLRERGAREMKEDNTPKRRKKVSNRMRLRLETVKKLRALGGKNGKRKREQAEKVNLVVPESEGAVSK